MTPHSVGVRVARMVVNRLSFALVFAVLSVGVSPRCSAQGFQPPKVPTFTKPPAIPRIDVPKIPATPQVQQFAQQNQWQRQVNQQIQWQRQLDQQLACQRSVQQQIRWVEQQRRMQRQLDQQLASQRRFEQQLRWEANQRKLDRQLQAQLGRQRQGW